MDARWTTVKCVSEDKENIFEFEGLTFNGQLETQVPLIIECPEIYYSKGGPRKCGCISYT